MNTLKNVLLGIGFGSTLGIVVRSEYFEMNHEKTMEGFLFSIILILLAITIHLFFPPKLTIK